MSNARAALLVASIFVVPVLSACGAQPPLDPPPAAGPAKATADAPGGGEPVKGVTAPPVSERDQSTANVPSDTPSVVVPPPPAPISCAALAAGGAPDSLVDFSWGRQVGPSSSSRDWRTVALYPGCIVQDGRDDVTGATTLSAVDCATAHAWVTNARFLEVLRTGSGCPYGEGNATETFELTLTPEGRVARKTYLCPETTLVLLRECLTSLLDRAFGR